MSALTLDPDQIDMLLADPLGPARAAKNNGAKLIGVLGGAAPREIIEAAGAFATRLRGGPPAPTPLADHYMEPVHEMWLRQVFDTMLAGGYGLLDAIVVPRSSEGLLQFYYLSEYVRSVEPDLALPPLILFDLLQTPGDLTADYVHQRVLGLAQTIGDITGDEVTARDLANQITVSNRARAAFRATIARPGTSGPRRLRLAAAGQLLDADDFRALCETAQHQWEATAPDAPTIVVSGAGHLSPAIYDFVAASGVDIAGEDHDWGERLYSNDIDETDDPFRALAGHYQNHGLGPRLFSPRNPETNIGDLRGAVFCFDVHDDTFGWDFPAHRARLVERGLPVTTIRMRDGTFASQDDAEMLSAFLENVKSGGAK